MREEFPLSKKVAPRPRRTTPLFMPLLTRWIDSYSTAIVIPLIVIKN